MLLTNQIRDRLLGLAPKVLFHGTRFLVPIIFQDELAFSNTTSLVHLTTCPDEAARIAAGPARPFDCGRGAIIALDHGRLENHDFLSYPLQPGLTETEWVCDSIHPLSEYIVGVFWVDGLVEGVGLAPRLPIDGPVCYPAHPYNEILARHFERLKKFEDRGVHADVIRPFDDVYEGGVYGVISPNGLTRDTRDDVYAPVLPGMRLVSPGGDLRYPPGHAPTDDNNPHKQDTYCRVYEAGIVYDAVDAEARQPTEIEYPTAALSACAPGAGVQA